MQYVDSENHISYENQDANPQAQSKNLICTSYKLILFIENSTLIIKCGGHLIHDQLLFFEHVLRFLKIFFQGVLSAFSEKKEVGSELAFSIRLFSHDRRLGCSHSQK